MTAKSRFVCLLAILTILGGTIFGVTGALGAGSTTTGPANPGQTGTGLLGPTANSGGGTTTGQSTPGQTNPGSPDNGGT
ncbi:MAG TPA: hypothetical protein VIX82_13700, partial [Solirubrobacteraceae bacterium]